MSKKLINGKILAIQLGRNETQLALIGKNSEILHGITVPTPMGAVEDGMIHNQEAITELLQQAMQTPEFKGVRQVVFSLCTSQVIMETTTTPDLPKAKLEKLIQANADMYFPVDIRDYRLVWEVVDVKKNDVGTKEASIQLWAVPNEMLRPYYQAANACGLSVAAIDYCGHSAATAVGATFARPAKPPKAKAAKDPAAPKEPKPKKKIDWNAEITFGKKKKVEPEVSQEEAGPRPIPATDMHILMDTELLGLTFVQEGQVVYQRFYRCGADPSYQFSELAMMLEYFQTQDIGRGSEIRGYVSGPGSMDADMVGLLSAMLGISLEAFQSEADPRWLLCTGAARSNLDFGNPEFNKTVRVRRTINTDLWQYASILVSGAALITVVLMLLNARLGWNSEISGLENQRNLLQIQAAKVSGFKDNYLSYESEYAAYDRDWENLFNSLHTYNDNLVFVLKELENVMPENTSVTDIIIDSDSVMISFACDDKEEAAYLIMSLRDMEYVDVNTISNLIGGGKGAATEYGTPIEEVTPPVEGGSEEEILVAATGYDPSLRQLSRLQSDTYQGENFIITPICLHAVDTIGTDAEVLPVDFKAFLQANSLLDDNGRKLRYDVVMGMLHNNPFVVNKIARIVGEQYDVLEEDIDNYTLTYALNLASGYMAQFDVDHVERAELKYLADDYLKATYIHYLEAALGVWGESVAPESFGTYCPYADKAILKEAASAEGAKDRVKDLWQHVENHTVPQQRTYSSAAPAANYQHVYSCAEAADVMEACTYLTTAGVCDVCAAECDHPESRTLGYVQIEGQLKHAITCECGVANLEADCADEAGDDEKCDDCGAFICSHSLEKGHTYTRTKNDDGLTHTVTCDCGEVITEAEACVENDNGKCDCGRNLCKHTNTIPERVTGSDTHNLVCDKCREVMEQNIKCVAVANDKCSCGRDMSCDHKVKKEEPIPSTSDKGKHVYTCECGTEILEEEDCVDKDPENQECDICGGEIPVPEVKPDNAPITRKDIEDLRLVYGDVPATSYETLASFMSDKKPTEYVKEAAIKNLIEKNAFAANTLISDVGPYLDFEIKDDEAFDSIMLYVDTLKATLDDEYEEDDHGKYSLYISLLDSAISRSADKDLWKFYIYYLEKAMNDDLSNTLPHLRAEPTDESKVTERIEKTLAYVKGINGGTLEKTRVPGPEVLMRLYLQDQEKDIKEMAPEYLEMLENYFNDKEIPDRYESEFEEAILDKNVQRLLKKEFESQYYYQETSGLGDNLETLIEDYRNGYIKNDDINEKLYISLSYCEQEVENKKDRDQDQALQDHEKDIANLKKELESLKKAASEKAKEEEAAAGGGGGGVKADTRVFLDIGLLYTEELWNQELQRKGLDRSAKLPRLEVEVG